MKHTVQSEKNECQNCYRLNDLIRRLDEEQDGGLSRMFQDGFEAGIKAVLDAQKKHREKILYGCTREEPMDETKEEHREAGNVDSH